MATWDEEAFKERLKEVRKRDPECVQLLEELQRHHSEYFRLCDEVNRLVKKTNEAKDEEDRKATEQKLELKTVERDRAFSKQYKPRYQQEQRYYELKRNLLQQELKTAPDNDLIQGELEEAERAIREYKEKVNKRQSQANSYEERLGLLKMEGLRESDIEDYTCVARHTIGFVYLPDTVPLTTVDIKSIDDETMYPKTSANEVSLTPVVSITSQSETLSADKPVIIELLKTVELSVNGDKNIVPMFSDTDSSIPPNWEDLHEECVELDDRIRFKTTHSNLFTVIARFSPPTASINVDPEADNQDQVLTVPELPGFSVTIQSKSVPSPTEVKATLYYNDSDESKESANWHLASACLLLEPEGLQFTENVSVQLPIPGYSKIISTNPGVKPQLMYSPTRSNNDWEIHEDMEIAEVGSDTVAKFVTDHFSLWKVVWPESVHGVTKAIGTIFDRVKCLGGRCQVFMTRETEVGSVINFSIQVLVYPFQVHPHEIPCNYHCILHDSGSLPIKFTRGDLHLALELNEEEKLPFEDHLQLSEGYADQAHFDVKLDKKSNIQLKEGAVIAHLSVRDSLKERKWNLIKPYEKEEPKISPSDVPLSLTVYLPSLTSTTRLGEEVLNEVIKCLWCARHKWSQIGHALMIHPTTVEVIKLDNHRTDDCFAAVILEWLKNSKAVPCWKVLAEALSSPPVGITVEERVENRSNENCTPELNKDENREPAVPLTTVDIKSIDDETMYPKTSANEVSLTPVVSITSQSETLSTDKPVIIELLKTVELSVNGDKNIVPIFSDTDSSIPPNWEDLHEECLELDDRIRFKTTHFNLFTVIARFSPPTASVNVDPEADNQDQVLTVPELPGFSVTIQSKSVPSPTEVKATHYYINSNESKESANRHLAAARCLLLESDGLQFTEKEEKEVENRSNENCTPELNKVENREDRDHADGRESIEEAEETADVSGNEDKSVKVNLSEVHLEDVKNVRVPPTIGRRICPCCRCC